MPAPRTDKELFSHLGPRLCAIITFHGIHRGDLAEELGCVQAFLTHICTGQKLLPADKLPKLAALLNVTPGQLLGTEDLIQTKTLNLPKK